MRESGARSPARRVDLEGVAPVLVFGAAALLYAQLVTGEFVYDDYPFIVNNPAVHTLARPWKFLVERAAMSEGGFYTIFRPMSGWIYSVIWSAVGPHPGVFHFVNAVAHGLAALCVWRLAAQLRLGRGAGALCCALVFAVHPVQTEAVAWIAGLCNPLFVIGVTCACVAWLRWRDAGGTRGALVAVCVWYVFGLLSKEHAVALPFLLMGLEWAMPAGAPRPARDRGLALGGLVLVTVLYVMWRTFMLGRTQQTGYWGGGIGPTAFTMVIAFCQYLRLLVWPVNLHPEYIVPVRMSLTAPGVLPGAVLLSGLGAMAVLMRRRFPIMALGIAWFFLALAPVSNVIPMKAIMNERMLYLPLIGFALCIGYLWDAWPRRWFRRLAAGGIVCFAVLTTWRIRDWQTSERLWIAAVAAEPLGYTSHFNLGEVYYRNGDTDRALHEYGRAIELRGQFPHAHGAVGRVHLERGEPYEAVRAFRQGVREDPESPRLRAGLVTALVAWGDAALAQEQYATAAGAYGEALQIDPGHTAAQAGLVRAREGHTP